MTEDSGFKLGKSPCIRDGDVLVSESAAILTCAVLFAAPNDLEDAL